MPATREIAERLIEGQRLSEESFRQLIASCDEPTLELLRSVAIQRARERFGRGIYVRGLIEISNRCKNDCLYCGIRASNSLVERYSLSQEQILSSCVEGYALGFRTFVLQGGESLALSDEWLVELIGQIRHNCSDAAITLSLGEREKKSYENLFRAGASRYLLRHEAASEELYGAIHPATMSHKKRIESLRNLMQIGYQTGMGMMVGVPYQRAEHLAEDLVLMQELQPQMVGVGPFIPHPDTPFGSFPAGELRQTLLMVALVRLILPDALIPATTAVATLGAGARGEAILSGANVVMPNLTPKAERANYALYANKASSGAEAAEGLRLLSQELEQLGYHIDFSRGDFKAHYPKEGTQEMLD